MLPPTIAISAQNSDRHTFPTMPASHTLSSRNTSATHHGLTRMELSGRERKLRKKKYISNCIVPLELILCRTLLLELVLISVSKMGACVCMCEVRQAVANALDCES